MKTIVRTLTLILVFLVAFTPGYGLLLQNINEEVALAQTTESYWKVGDQWIYEVRSILYPNVPRKIATQTTVVTGEEIIEGEDCYTVDISYDHPVGGITRITHSIQKNSRLPIKTQLNYQVEGTPGSSIINFSYKNLEGSPKMLIPPLKVGNEWKYELKATSYTTGEPYEQRKSEATAIRMTRVEEIEEVSVPAGKFSCYRITSYDESGKVLETYWFSEEANNIKMIDYTSGVIRELISYSLV